MTLTVSTLDKEGVYQGSKWLKFQILCEAEELAHFLKDDFSIFPIGGIGDGKAIEKEKFLEIYRGWIEGLKGGRIPREQELRLLLAAAFVEDLSALWLQEVVGKGYLVKIAKPVVQVQAHFFTYSRADGVFRPMSLGVGSIFWGLQFSYPQIYQDAKTMELQDVEENPLFKRVRLWVRDVSRATPFFVDGKRVNSPIRLGKNCFSWIARHPQLQAQNIEVFHAG